MTARDTRIRRRLLVWATTVDRPLPWRGERDPYRVLVSEVMLQQTQAPRVVAHYLRFLDAFPTAGALAAADPADVLRAWAGLGYNRRALALHGAAAIVDAGGFPGTVDEIRRLPGVGDYTARAVASFAFGVPVAVVEANVRRIVTRLDGLPPDADVRSRADDLLPRGRAADWNQALMDFGSLVCRPRSPGCEACPLRAECAWFAGARPGRRRPRPAPPRFEETTRFARGRVLAAIRESAVAMTLASLSRATGLAQARVRAASEGLARDGLVVRAEGGFRLPQRARARS